MILFSGSSNLPLAQKIAEQLNIKLGECEIKRFPDGECKVWVKEDVKDREVFVVQSLSYIADQNLMELCLFGDALKRLGASHVTAVIPWLGYSKQDKEFRRGEAVSVQLVAKFIETAGFDKVITLDLHSPNIKNYFKIPVSELSARELLGQEADGKKLKANNEYIVVSPDKGGAGRSEKFAEEEKLSVVHMDKTRDLATGKVEIRGIDTEVKDKNAIIFDDIINTGSTAIETAKYLHEKAVKSILFLATHAVLAGDASKKIQESFIDQVVVSDTIEIPKEKVFTKLKIVSTASLLSEALTSQNSKLKTQI